MNAAKEARLDALMGASHPLVKAERTELRRLLAEAKANREPCPRCHQQTMGTWTRVSNTRAAETGNTEESRCTSCGAVEMRADPEPSDWLRDGFGHTISGQLPS